MALLAGDPCPGFVRNVEHAEPTGRSGADNLASAIEKRLLHRNQIFEAFFAEEARPLALLSKEMSERFLNGGRILAFGRGPYAADAQRISVQFMQHKRALPALDLSLVFRPWLEAILRVGDIVVGFGPPQGDVLIEEALAMAHARGALTLGLPGIGGSYVLESPTQDPFLHQELIQMLYHMLWETVHVFLEHRAAATDQVAASIEMKAQECALLRAAAAREESPQMITAGRAIYDRIQQGGQLILFGDGASAADANGFAIDCVRSTRWIQGCARDLLVHGTRRSRTQSCPSVDRACARGRCRYRDLYLRRVAKRDRGAGGGTQAWIIHSGAAGP